MDYVLLEGYSDSTAKWEQLGVIMLNFKDILSVWGEPDLCLSEEPDGHEWDRGRKKLSQRYGQKWEWEKDGQGAVESGESPATVVQSMMMNDFDRDNQDEMLMWLCQRMQLQPD